MVTDIKARPRTATLVVAASNSLDTVRADYVCDGVADEVQINAAIAALPATGGSVVLMDGTYDIDSSIIMNKSNVTLTGQGKNTIIQTDTPLTMVNTASTNGILIKNIYFYGVNSSGCYGVYLQSNNSNVVNCWFYNCYYGVYIREDYNTVYGCYFQTGSRGVHCRSSAYYNSVMCNRMQNLMYGVDIVGWLNAAVANVSYNCSRCVNLSSRYSTATGNVGYNGFAVVQMGQDNCLIQGNVSRNCTHCIYASNADAATICGNSAASSTGNSFELYACHGITLNGNGVYDERGNHAFSVWNCSKVNISGNVMLKIDQHGIWLNVVHHSVIANNIIHDCSENSNNSYDGIHLTGNSTYNVVSSNRVSGDAANKHRYGVRENAVGDDWNLLHGNILTDAITANLSSNGPNSVSADNIAP